MIACWCPLLSNQQVGIHTEDEEAESYEEQSYYKHHRSQRLEYLHGGDGGAYECCEQDADTDGPKDIWVQ